MGNFRESDFVTWKWRRWVEAYPVGAQRIDDARRLAQRGDVQTIDSSFGAIHAQVSGRAGETYQVEIDFTQYDPSVWDNAIARLENLPHLKSGWMEGYLSDAIEEAFAATGIRLVPDRYKDVRHNCSCPDWIKPCKHALAVLFAFGDYFRTDPLLLSKLRGYGRRPDAHKDTLSATEAAEKDAEEFPLSEDFFGDHIDHAALRQKLLAPVKPMHYISRLGRFVFWGMKHDMEFSFRLLIDEVRSEAEGLRQMMGEQKP